MLNPTVQAGLAKSQEGVPVFEVYAHIPPDVFNQQV